MTMDARRQCGREREVLMKMNRIKRIVGFGYKYASVVVFLGTQNEMKRDV